jgi:hypothetical protein
VKLPWFLLGHLNSLASRIMRARPQCDRLITGRGDYRLARWYVTPWSNYDRESPPTGVRGLTRLLPQVYLHLVSSSDDDRALHDHPWPNASIILRGFYWEHTIAAGGVHHKTLRSVGDVVLRRSTAAHRLEVDSRFPAVTLFITGPVIRLWGFHCPQGWRDWKLFTGGRSGPARGCE